MTREAMYYDTNKGKPYIVFEDKNLDFTQKEVRIFDRLIERGFSIPEIARRIRRNRLEVLLLYLDRVDKEIVDPVYKLTKS
ncbi:hypothetical protein M3225_26715 [Priestia aryabhattai]|uniref:hypothetical protein n=1 Tax=Priestia aryabhattai TaxID=412384 RepID=UPI00203C8D41|nr:hypothetical protein [Priestia aryabhattai]MCM3774012.1 hypothetical protein [Priestia aryabhattai]